MVTLHTQQSEALNGRKMTHSGYPTWASMSALVSQMMLRTGRFYANCVFARLNSPIIGIFSLLGCVKSLQRHKYMPTLWPMSKESKYVE